jgi:hypothetical protein
VNALQQFRVRIALGRRSILAKDFRQASLWVAVGNEVLGALVMNAGQRSGSP